MLAARAAARGGNRGGRFIFVYIAEAHACDEWPIAQLGAGEIARHITLEQRRAAALQLQASPYALREPWEVTLDTLGESATADIDGAHGSDADAFDRVFASWPFRFWVLVDGRIALKPQPHDASYDIGELERWLDVHHAACDASLA